MSGFLAVCVRLSLHRGRGWEREVQFCGRINKREIVSKWFVFGFLKEFCPRL